jgi:hypothetical protein
MAALVSIDGRCKLAYVALLPNIRVGQSKRGRGIPSVTMVFNRSDVKRSAVPANCHAGNICVEKHQSPMVPCLPAHINATGTHVRRNVIRRQIEDFL